MIKYNYKKAGDLYKRMIDIIYDMPDYLDSYYRQKDRRYFMRELTRDGDMSTYYDIITDFIKEYATDSERVKLEKIALEICLFTNEV